MRRTLPLLLAATVWAEPRIPAGSAEINRALDRLPVLGSVLMIAAHPDDENTALLAWCAKGRNYRTAYLSLTRGEGGQNLIGPEQGELMGLIRTQELLMARRIDGASQLFTRAIDFGFSKTADETLAKWGREAILGDVVWNIRRFQPDVIVLRFSGTPRDGHGQHQASAMLGREAYDAAADPARFPDQLTEVKPWRPKRILHNLPAFTPEMIKAAEATPGKIEIDLGEYDPLSGYSYSEIAGMSRSLHRSQAMGWPERKGSVRDFLRVTGGEPAQSDLFDGIDTSWARVPGGAAVAVQLESARRAFDPRKPESIVGPLLAVRAAIAKLDGPWPRIKLGETDALIAQAAGLWLDAAASRAVYSPGDTVPVQATAILRAHGIQARLLGVSVEDQRPEPSPGPLAYNKPVTRSLNIRLDAQRPYSQPFWIEQPPDGTIYRTGSRARVGPPDTDPFLEGTFRVEIQGQELVFTRPVVYRTVDPALGELTRSPVVAPAVAVEFAERPLMFTSAHSRQVTLRLKSNRAGVSGTVSIEAPAGWKAEPASAPFSLTSDGETAAAVFTVTPPALPFVEKLRAVARTGGTEIRHGMRVVSYGHIPPRTVFPAAEAPVVRTDAKVLARRVGYVMGAGDDVPQAVRQLGCEVALLEDSDLAGADLSKFDAIVTGVRAYNVRPALHANQQRLLDYAAAGGTLIVQYNVAPSGFFSGRDQASLDRIGPYPIKLGLGRITVEDAPVRALNQDHPLLQAPNRITAADYSGWVQERGLYFASEWDPRYTPLWEIADPGEKPLQGGTLFARHGKGVYIFTPVSWFRQLPAGVPGAYRLFANLLSAGQVR
ncbi:MAG: PIG-L family deacetylase [Acidobacteria bacterium]|nr:PIG-L family deacetylase [Acidobacteriota bacterium]